jgi:UDP-N-acetylglucosamine 4,6-dehydratase/5-epimerase
MKIDAGTNHIDNKAILVTGGTGSFGKFFIRRILTDYSPRKVIVFSRDELKQFEMQQNYRNEERLRFFLGDVRDKERLYRAFEGVDTVIHAAALKQVPAAEFNPFECIKTNVLGAQNIVDVAMDSGVSRLVALSTDKAAAPINLYGATKLCSDKLFVAANNFKGARDIRFSVVRYGNVMGSRGSVIPFFLELRKSGEIPITDERMTRFNITLAAGVQLVIDTLLRMWGGEIVVPKIPSYRILDVAEAVAPSAKKRIVGIRPGEKIHEEMITETDGINTIEFKDSFAILPSTRLWDPEKLRQQYNGKFCQFGFRYNSGTNTEWLSVDALRRLIVAHVDAAFHPI